MNNKLYGDLNRIRREDFIWGVYLIVILMALVSNYFEKQYVMYKDNFSRKRYVYINRIIFTTLLFVYIYFVIDGYNQVSKLNINDNKRKINNTFLSYTGSVVNLIGGIIFLYVAYSTVYYDEVADIGI